MICRSRLRDARPAWDRRDAPETWPGGPSLSSPPLQLDRCWGSEGNIHRFGHGCERLAGRSISEVGSRQSLARGSSGIHGGPSASKASSSATSLRSKTVRAPEAPGHSAFASRIWRSRRAEPVRPPAQDCQRGSELPQKPLSPGRRASTVLERRAGRAVVRHQV